MQKENLENPCCPRCAHTLRNNGKTKNGKLRFRCSRCGYSETKNSTVHNSNVRTWQGYTKRESLDAQYKNRARSYRHNHTTKAENCLICSSTEHLEAHEFDYNKPLDTCTFCRNCHKLTHKLLDQIENNPLDPQLITLLFGSRTSMCQPRQKLEPNLCYTLAVCGKGVSYL